MSEEQAPKRGWFARWREKRQAAEKERLEERHREGLDDLRDVHPGDVSARGRTVAGLGERGGQPQDGL